MDYQCEQEYLEAEGAGAEAQAQSDFDEREKIKEEINLDQILIRLDKVLAVQTDVTASEQLKSVIHWLTDFKNNVK